MKFITFLMLFGLLNANATSYSQITLEYKNVPLQKVFKDIRKQSGYNILCDASLLQGKIVPEISIKNSTVTQSIDAAIKFFPLGYIIKGKTIVIVKKAKVELPATSISPQIIIPQKITVTGVITNEQGQAMPAVTVTEKGTTRSVISNNDGSYSISVNENATLVFSFIGYQQLEIVVGNRSKINVVMNQQLTTLGKVAVTALGIKREKKALGYSVGEVKGEDIQKAKDINVVNSLAGRVPGLVIDQTAGGAGGSTKVILRGYTEMTGDNQPLYVVDGVPLDNTNYAAFQV